VKWSLPLILLCFNTPVQAYQSPTDEYARVEVRGVLSTRQATGKTNRDGFYVVVHNREWKLGLHDDRMLIYIVNRAVGTRVTVTGNLDETVPSQIKAERIEPDLEEPKR
jgi:hypothetical protein